MKGNWKRLLNYETKSAKINNLDEAIKTMPKVVDCFLNFEKKGTVFTDEEVLVFYWEYTSSITDNYSFRKIRVEKTNYKILDEIPRIVDDKYYLRICILDYIITQGNVEFKEVAKIVYVQDFLDSKGIYKITHEFEDVYR